MRVVGRERLSDFVRSREDAQSRVAAWLAEVEDAKWADPHDVKRRYPSASLLGAQRVVFNVGGNRYRIDTKISYEHQTVLVIRVGTHSEYDQWTF